MHKINGYLILAHRTEADGSFVILGARPKPFEPEPFDRFGGTEFVTARMRDLADNEWFIGHYFSSREDDATALADALSDFNVRSSKPTISVSTNY